MSPAARPPRCRPARWVQRVSTRLRAGSSKTSRRPCAAGRAASGSARRARAGRPLRCLPALQPLEQLITIRAGVSDSKGVALVVLSHKKRPALNRRAAHHTPKPLCTNGFPPMSRASRTGSHRAPALRRDLHDARQRALGASAHIVGVGGQPHRVDAELGAARAPDRAVAGRTCRPRHRTRCGPLPQFDASV